MIITAPYSGFIRPSSVVTELADNFTIGADASLSAHNTSTGNYAWARATGGGTMKDISATGNAQDQSGAGAAGLYYVNHTISSADYTVTCDISYPNTADTNIYTIVSGRYNGSGVGVSPTAYYIRWVPNGTSANVGPVYLAKIVSNVVSNLGSLGGITGLSHTVKLVMKGTTISGYCDGTLIASVTDSSIAAAGFVSIGSGADGGGAGGTATAFSTYDNLLVTIP